MNIYLKVYLDKNFGDDAMLISFVEAFSDINIYLFYNGEFSLYYKNMMSEYKNVRLTEIELRHIRRFGKGFFNYVVLLGGSTLQGSSYKGCFYRIRNIFSIFRSSLSGTKYCILGCNTGPFTNCITRFFVKMEVKLSRFITTRDIDSYNFLCDVNKKAIIHVLPDILFQVFDKKKSAYKNNNKRAGLGISAFYQCSPTENTELARISDEYIQQTGNNVVLFSFSMGRLDDHLSAEAIYDAIQNKNHVHIFNYDGNIDTLLSELSKLEQLIAIRFHAAVAGISLAIPLIPVCYSNKMSNLLCDLNYCQDNIFLDDIKTISKSKYMVIKTPKNILSHYNVFKQFIQEGVK